MQKQGTIVYSTRPSSASKQAGRLVDAELWSKVSPALAIGKVNPEQLQDAEVAVNVSVIDARKKASLDVMGFELVEAESLGNEVTKSTAMAAAVAVAKKRLPDALEFFPFDTTFRSSARDNRDSSKGPGGRASNLSSAVGRAHADFSPESARLKIDQLIHDGTLPSSFSSSKQWAILNVWRPLNIVYHAPLCFLDPATQSLPSFSYALAYEHQAGFNASIQAESCHQWYFFDTMTPNEAVLFWNFDQRKCHNDPLGTGGSVYHAALDAHIPPSDPNMVRYSVEVRILILFS